LQTVGRQTGLPCAAPRVHRIDPAGLSSGLTAGHCSPERGTHRAQRTLGSGN